ncbi:efflux RND transporter periplasmic adaptor subunit [Pacificimonas sp. WHA3]|uniref:Efflux RND transporter periplasmic adaptor subunit n=1 Tax=Pacificimonas pallii TaxID=2827236 RepID=A0ABS6SGW8_9SPHN|nr:efflux RND transporter periplasmic adaptor subunit [Pacificimonas pallii]MBV7257171.1 efflux RND transporter periplasmic adaptor subunit [Pacificimonas pallii]
MNQFFRPAVLIAALTALSSCGDGGGGGREDRAPTAVGGHVTETAFSESIEAVGTAYAKEQTVLTAPVTERIERINFTDGAEVRRGAIIAQLSRSEETADLAAIQARAREAGQQLDRLRELQERGFATRASVEAQQALRDSARADANAVRSQIDDRVVRAPFDGVIGLRTISAGAVISAGSPIATVSDISSINLDFTVPESFLSAIEVGQSIEARAAAYPDDVFRGDVDGIEPLVDPLSRSVTVRANIPNPDRRLRPGMLLSVEIVSGSRTSLAVPETALVSQGDRSFVFRVEDGEDGVPVARRTAIETGMRKGGFVEIRSGVEKGDTIIVDGTVKVRDDAPVQPVFPEKEPPGGRGGSPGANGPASAAP